MGNSQESYEQMIQRHRQWFYDWFFMWAYTGCIMLCCYPLGVICIAYAVVAYCFSAYSYYLSRTWR